MRGFRQSSTFGDGWVRWRSAPTHRRFRGATLLEVAFVTAIIGIGVTAMMEFMASATRTNSALSDNPVGLAIAKAGHEWAKSLEYADLEALFPVLTTTPKVTYRAFRPSDAPVNSASPLLNVAGGSLAQLPSTQNALNGWSQLFTMRKVDPVDLQDTDDTGTSPAMEITVQALKDGRTVSSISKLYYFYAKSGS